MPNKINTKKISKYARAEFLKSKYKQKLLKSREKRHITCRGENNELTADNDINYT